MNDMKDYQQKMQEQMEQWQDQIGKWQEQAQAAQANAAGEYQKYVEQLMDKQKDMQSNLEQMQSASVDAWKDFKTGADKAWEEMSKAMAEAMKRFS